MFSRSRSRKRDERRSERDIRENNSERSKGRERERERDAERSRIDKVCFNFLALVDPNFFQIIIVNSNFSTLNCKTFVTVTLYYFFVSLNALTYRTGQETKFEIDQGRDRGLSDSANLLLLILSSVLVVQTFKKTNFLMLVMTFWLNVVQGFFPKNKLFFKHYKLIFYPFALTGLSFF